MLHKRNMQANHNKTIVVGGWLSGKCHQIW